MKRLAVIAALALSACSPAYDVCGPSTCDGCCTATGECVAGDYDLACGTGGNACNVCPASAPRCLSQVCRAADVVDAGHDAGTDAGVDAGVPIFVTLRYERLQAMGECPAVTTSAVSCAIAKVMDKSRFDAIRTEYATCAVTQPTSDGYEIDCGACSPEQAKCHWEPDGGTPGDVGYASFKCPEPAHTTPGACAWSP